MRKDKFLRRAAHEALVKRAVCETALLRSLGFEEKAREWEMQTQLAQNAYDEDVEGRRDMFFRSVEKPFLQKREGRENGIGNGAVQPSRSYTSQTGGTAPRLRVERAPDTAATWAAALDKALGESPRIADNRKRSRFTCAESVPSLTNGSGKSDLPRQSARTLALSHASAASRNTPRAGQPPRHKSVGGAYVTQLSYHTPQHWARRPWGIPTSLTKRPSWR